MNAGQRTSPPAEGGFTLIEVLMAMLILTVGLLGLLQSVSLSYEHNLRKRLREEAVALAEEQLDWLRMHAALAPLTTATVAVGGVSKEFAVTRRSDAIGGSSNKLTVAVSWSFKNISTSHEIYTIKKGD